MPAAAASRPAVPPCISLRDVSVTFEARGRRIQALSNATLEIAEGEFVALLGPTGCGKSTLLRIISDLLRPTEGVLLVRGQPAAEARRRNDFGFVFQEAALLPWRTALTNIRLPLEVVGYAEAKRNDRCDELLASMGLSSFGNNFPSELSGGMKQRVAIARALSWNPSILLMDEPFSALDEITKNQLQDELLRIWEREQKTIVFVTHNMSEAIYLADRVVVMSAHPGRIHQVIDVVLPRRRGPDIRDTINFVEQVRLARTALMQS
jgi:NitT/TauT family transport system ATP-binding protein